jgi:hypothetical protein
VKSVVIWHSPRVDPDLAAGLGRLQPGTVRRVGGFASFDQIRNRRKVGQMDFEILFRGAKCAWRYLNAAGQRQQDSDSSGETA